MKKKWISPKIEMVPLEFDKDMGEGGCFLQSSSKNQPESADCQVPGVSFCWTGGPQKTTGTWNSPYGLTD